MSNNKKRTFTAEEIAVIGKEYGRNKSPDELAKQFGVLRSTIHGVARNLRARGFNIPKVSGTRSSKYEEAMKILKKDSSPSSPKSK